MPYLTTYHLYMSIFGGALMCSLILSLECLCIQMVLNPTVIPRDAALKAYFNRPKYSKAEVQEDLKEEAKM